MEPGGRVSGINLSASLLIRRRICMLLETMKMLGHIKDFTEVKAFFSSEFYIKGADHVALQNFLDWESQMEQKP